MILASTSFVLASHSILSPLSCGVDCAAVSEEKTGQLTVRAARVDEAALMQNIIVEAFSARQALNPPAEALSETIDSVRERLEREIGVLAFVDDQPAGCLFLDLSGPAMLRRVAVLPKFRKASVASEMVRAGAEVATDEGFNELQIVAREELPEVISWWARHGFTKRRRVAHGFVLGRRLPARYEILDEEAMKSLGRGLAKVVRAGDLIIASGELGAGKTTFTQGLGEGMQVSGPVISPTFVLSRIHPAKSGPALVHVDAYRLSSTAELEDIDLDVSMDEAVTLVEWGEGIAEGLSADRLDIEIVRLPSSDTRIVYLDGIGSRWQDVDLTGLDEAVK